MLDIIDFIAERGGNPEKIRESQRKRFAPVEIVDEIIALYEEHRASTFRCLDGWMECVGSDLHYAANYSASQVSTKINAVQKQIGAKKKVKSTCLLHGAPYGAQLTSVLHKIQAKENADELLQQKVELEAEKKQLADLAAEKQVELNKKVKTVGNLVHDSVPVSNNEDNNRVERTWTPEGVTVEKKDCLSHHEVLLRLDGYDPERGAKIVGHRGYFLRQWGVFLNQALINYGLSFLAERGYTPLQTPQFMLKDYMGKTAQLEQFDEELYKVSEGDPKLDKYLIATSEQPISAFHADEWLLAKDLPLK
jgi:seryl-tRNA synthetase